MRAGEDRDFSFKRALGLSTLLHLVVLPLVIAILLGGPYEAPAFQVDQTSEGSVAVLTIEHRPPHPAAAPPHAAAKSERTSIVRRTSHKPSPSHAAPVAARHSPSPAAVTGRSNKPTRLAALLHAAAATAEPAFTPRAAPTQAATARASASTGAATASAAPSPSPSPAASTSPVRLVDAPPGGWGQNFRDPTVFDDDALSALRARFHTAIAHVAVDENGRATNVTVEGGDMDSDARADLAARLRTLRYIPAECNGLRCAATFDLKL